MRYGGNGSLTLEEANFQVSGQGSSQKNLRDKPMTARVLECRLLVVTFKIRRKKARAGEKRSGPVIYRHYPGYTPLNLSLSCS
jgi:hypothetical protein